MDKQDAGNMIVLTLIEFFILGHLFLHHFQGKIQLLLLPRRHFRHLQLYFLNSRPVYLCTVCLSVIVCAVAINLTFDLVHLHTELWLNQPLPHIKISAGDS